MHNKPKHAEPWKKENKNYMTMEGQLKGKKQGKKEQERYKIKQIQRKGEIGRKIEKGREMNEKKKEIIDGKNRKGHKQKKEA